MRKKTKKAGKQVKMEFNEEKRSDLLKVDPFAIVADESENPRIDYGDMEWLITDIMQNGVKDPVYGKRIEGTDQFKLFHGFRRVRATIEAQKRLKAKGLPLIERIPLILVAKTYNAEDAYADHFTRNSGKPLNPIEEMHVIMKLESFGWDRKKIAQRLNLTESAVSNKLRLNTFPEKIKKEISSGRISSTLALKVSREHNGDMDETVKVLEGVLRTSPETSGGTERKVTQKDVDKAEGKTDPIKLIRGFLKDNVERDIHKDHVSKFVLLKKIADGTLKKEDLDGMLVDDSASQKAGEQEAEVFVVQANPDHVHVPETDTE